MNFVYQVVEFSIEKAEVRLISDNEKDAIAFAKSESAKTKGESDFRVQTVVSSKTFSAGKIQDEEVE